MPRKTDISVVVVSYNVKQYLEQSLDSIFKALKGFTAEVFVIDNDSGDGSSSMVKKRFPRVRLIENRENTGFARANNQALSLSAGEFVCLINPDTLVREDTFRVCLGYLRKHPEAGAAGCKILNPDGTLQLACRRSFPTPWIAFSKITGLSRLFPKSRLFGRYNLTYLDPDQTAEVEALSGSFMMVRRKAVDQVGFLDEDFFLYGEDLDWCYRIHEKGWKIVYLPSTQIVHYKGRSTQEASMDSLKVFYGAMRLFVKKHFRSGWSFIPQWILLTGIGLRWMVSFFTHAMRGLAVPLVDLIIMQVGLVLALLIRFGDLSYYGLRYVPVDAVYSLVWLGSLYLLGLYEKGVFSASRAVGGVLIGLVFNTSLTFFFPMYAFSRQVVLTAGMLNLLFLSGWRLGIRFLSRIPHFPFFGTVGRTLVRRRALVVGTGKSSRNVYNRLVRQIDAGYDLVGALALNDRDMNRTMPDGAIRVLGTLKDIARICRIHRIRSVIFSPESVSYERILGLVAESKHLQVEFKMVPRDLDAIIGKTSIDSLEDIPLVNLEYKLLLGPNRFLKRAMDLTATILLSPAYAVSCAYFGLHPAYRSDSVRIQDGFGGQTLIRLPKRNDGTFPQWAIFSLLGDVFLGKLSLVGDEILPTDPSGTGVRIKPGLTGLIQINAKKNLSTEDRKKYRLYYLRNYSPLLDLEIVIRTVFH